MIFMFEHDRNGGFRAKVKVEKFPVMTRIIWGFWSVAYFRKIGINDLGKAFAKDEENVALKDLCRWLAKGHMQWHKLRHKALLLNEVECKEFLKGNFPIVQGTGNQINLEKIGEKAVKTENLNKAVKILLED